MTGMNTIDEAGQPGMPGIVLSSDGLGHAPRHPTLEECKAAGSGPTYMPGTKYASGGLPDTPDERARFAAYMAGHCWEIGKYSESLRAYDSMQVRCLYGVWRDRGSLPTVWPNVSPATS